METLKLDMVQVDRIATKEDDKTGEEYLQVNLSMFGGKISWLKVLPEKAKKFKDFFEGHTGVATLLLDLRAVSGEKSSFVNTMFVPVELLDFQPLPKNGS